MTSENVKIAKIKNKAEARSQILDLVKQTSGDTKDILLGILLNPAISMVAAWVLVDMLNQKITISKGRTLKYDSNGNPYWQETRETILAANSAAELKRLLAIGGMLDALGNAAGGIAGLIGSRK